MAAVYKAHSLVGLTASLLAITLTPVRGELHQPGSDKTSLLIERLARYRDRLEREASRLTLLQAIKTGLEQNPILAKRYYEIQQSQWQAIAIRREWVPTLLADSDDPGVAGYSVDSYQSTTDDAKTSGRQTSTRRNSTLTYPEVELQWTFFDPTRTPRLKSNLAALKADEWLFDVTARNLVLQIQESYYSLQQYSALESDYRELFTIAREATRLAEKKRQAGSAKQSDVSQLKSFEYSLLTRRINIHEEVLKTAARLALGLSLPPGELAMPADPQQLNGSWTMSLQSTIEQALSLREEIKQSLATAESHSWLAMASDKITLPTFYFQYRAEFVYGQYRQVNQPSNHSSFAAGRESNVYTDAGLYFNWPLFNGGINTAEANALRKSSMQAEKQAELDRLTVTSQVQTSHASYISSLIVVDSAADEVRSSLIALREARDDFGKGKTNATTLVQILASVRKATDDYRDAVTKHNISVAELYRYSASWPDTALPILQRKVQQLRHQ